MTWLTNLFLPLFYKGFVVNRVVNEVVNRDFFLVDNVSLLTFFLYYDIFIVRNGVGGMTRNEITSSTREKEMEHQLNNKRGNTVNNKKTKEYLSRPEVKEFNRELRKRVFNSVGYGRPYAFESREKLEEEIISFFELCDRTNTIPTVVNLSVWLGCNRDTIYAHANDSNSPYSDIFKNVINFFHGSIESSAIGGAVNPVLYMFLSKNYFGLKDDKNIQISASDNSNINTQETADALRKQIELETTPNANVVQEN